MGLLDGSLGPVGRVCSLPLLSLLVFVAVAPVDTARASPGARRIAGRAGELDLRVGPTDPKGLPPTEGLWPGTPPRRVVLVQAEGDAEALARDLASAGDEILGFVPPGGWLARVPSDRIEELRTHVGIRWVGEPRAAWKLDPDIGLRPYRDPDYREGGRFTLDVDLYPGEDGGAVAESLGAIGALVLGRQAAGPRERLRVRAAPALLETIAGHPAVDWVEEAGEATPRNNATRWVIQSNVQGSFPVWSRGLRGEGQIIGHIDGRIDMSSCYFRDMIVPVPGPAHRKVVAYRSSTGLGADVHGTHTAGSAAGDQFPISGGTSGNGQASAARISHSNVGDIAGSGTLPSNLYAYLAAAHLDGARVHTNSWGDDGTVAYTSWCRDVDQFSRDHEDSLVVFAATNTTSLKSPENAKNCLSVGASHNGTSAGNFCSGGAGPTRDGRRKPEVFAPGCSIVSARSSFACSTMSLSGTSMAAPAVAAAGTLVRQYFTEGWYPTGARDASAAFVPTGALLKAMLVNAAVDMAGIPDYPGTREGWGRILLEGALHFAGEARTLRVRDVRHAAGVTTGDLRDLVVRVDDASEPLRITLAWSDPPASLLASPAWINDLDLEARSPDGTLYLGNVFAGGGSVPGGSPDPANNVEQIVLPAPVVGDWLITVRARSVPLGPQGYALVATGRLSEAAGAFLVPDGVSFTDTCRTAPVLSGNGALNPGESLDLRVRLRNAGDAVATGVRATLASGSSKLAVVDGHAAYPDILPGESADPLPGDGYTVVVAESAQCGAALDLRQTASTPPVARSSALSLEAQGLPRVEIWSDDFETDRGWALAAPNDATTGTWERGDPEGTDAQPEDDRTPDPGTQCWVTGLASGGGLGANDVDGGSTTLLSPPIDLSASVDPELEYWRWYTNDHGASPYEDFWVAQVSFDDGATWRDLERTNRSEAFWSRRAFRLRAIGTPGAATRLRFIASDLGNGSLVEAALDDVAITETGGCGVCPDASTPPGEVGDLRLAKGPPESGGFVLSWSEPPAGGRPADYALYVTSLDAYAPACAGSLGTGTTAYRAELSDGGLLVVASNAGGTGPAGAGRPALPSCP